MDQQPKIPTLKDSQKPQVKVRGLEAGVTLFDRLKQFKKKDLAFILAGLGTLFMAPLAEHFMMSPEGGDATLGAGFGGGKGAGNGNGIFGSGGSVGGYDSVNGQAPGSAIGGGSDVITPLNVRDPSALVMGPGATQQPPTNSVAPASPPPTAPVTRSDSDLKDALAASARGVSAGAHAAKSLLPIPKVALTGSGLHGLGAASGGSSASAGLSPISSNGIASGKANAGGGGLNMVHAAPGYAGVGKRGQSAGGGGLEGLKAAAGNAGEVMNRGAASNALDTAASQAIPAGGANFSGSGQGGAGTGDKPDSGNQGKDSKSTGDSLEFMKQKAMQEAKIALWAKEQEAGDGKLEMLKIRNTAMETFATEMVKGASAKMSACMFKGFKNKDCMGTAADLGQYICSATSGGQRDMTIDGGSVGDCSGDEPDWLAPNGTIFQCGSTGDPSKGGKTKAQATPVAYSCVSDGAKTKAGDAKPAADNRSVGTGVVGDVSSPPVTGMKEACKTLSDASSALTTAGGFTTEVGNINNLLTQAKTLVSIRDALGSSAGTGSGPTGDCGANTGDLASVKTPVIKQLNSIVTNLNGQKQIIDQMDDMTAEKEEAKLEPLTKAVVGDQGIVKSIGVFNADVQAVVDYGSKLDAGILGNKNIVDPAKLAQIGEKGKGAAYAASVTGAIGTVQSTYNTLDRLVKNLNQTSTTDLKPQIDALTKAAGNGAGGGGPSTLNLIIHYNAKADSIGGEAGNKKIVAPLTPPKFSPQDKDAAGAVTPEAMDAVEQKIIAANKKVKDYNDPAITPKEERVAGSPKTAETQKTIDDAATSVRGLRSGQKGVDATIRSAVTTAGGRVGL